MTNPITEVNPTTNTTAEEAALTCTIHPKVETSLRCNKCGRPMCSKCAVRTPVGYRCKECVRGQKQIYYNANRLDPVIQFAITFVAAAIATPVAGLLNFGFFSWLIAFWVGSAAGALAADLAHRAVGKRRGEYSWLIVAGGIVAGGVIGSFFAGFSLTALIFVAMAVSGAVGRLRLGR